MPYGKVSSGDCVCCSWCFSLPWTGGLFLLVHKKELLIALWMFSKNIGWPPGPFEVKCSLAIFFTGTSSQKKHSVPPAGTEGSHFLLWCQPLVLWLPYVSAGGPSPLQLPTCPLPGWITQRQKEPLWHHLPHVNFLCLCRISPVCVS